MTYVQVWSKLDQRRLRKTLQKQTDKPTDTTKIMVTWPWTNRQNCQHCIKTCANELNDMKLRYFIVQNKQQQYDMIVLNTKCLNVDCVYKRHFSHNNTAALTLGVNSRDTRKQLYLNTKGNQKWNLQRLISCSPHERLPFPWKIFCVMCQIC